MATYKIRVTRNGTPLAGAKVVVGHLLNLTTDANGIVSKTAAAFSDDLCLPVFVKAAGESGSGTGFGSVLLEPGGQTELSA